MLKVPFPVFFVPSASSLFPTILQGMQFIQRWTTSGARAKWEARMCYRGLFLTAESYQLANEGAHVNILMHVVVPVWIHTSTCTCLTLLSQHKSMLFPLSTLSSAMLIFILVISLLTGKFLHQKFQCAWILGSKLFIYSMLLMCRYGKYRIVA